MTLDTGVIPDVVAAATRAGASIVIVADGGTSTLQKAAAEGADVVIAPGGEDPVRLLRWVREAGGREVTVLELMVQEGIPTLTARCLAMLTDPQLDGVNVPVPTLEEPGARAALWGAMREHRLEERHQLVEVDGRPALGEAGKGTRSADDAIVLAAAAAGVLAGRMAASNRRWRAQLHP